MDRLRVPSQVLQRQPRPFFDKLRTTLTTNQQQNERRQNMATPTFRPLGDRVLVQPLEEGEVKKGGIIIPDTAKEKPQEAKVIAIGTGKVDDEGKKKPFEVKVGDRVLISKYGGTEIKIDGTAYQVLREDDILGILA
jgi:chaperonin GroES